jgi:ubiquinone/menaquinone biosynthesis C-methylase UbiE
MYRKSAAFYDAIHSYKNYEREAQIVHKLIWRYRLSTGRRLLDVGCGTGRHIEHLQKDYAVIGLDVNPELLKIAHQRCPDVEFYEADMVDFALGIQVDVITCLFDAIGYVQTLPRLQQALRVMKRHLRPGGVILIEPGPALDQVHSGTLRTLCVEEPDRHVSCMILETVQGRAYRAEHHYLVGTPQDGVCYFSEQHNQGLFTHDDYLGALYENELDVVHEREGLTGRGLYIGIRPLD